MLERNICHVWLSQNSDEFVLSLCSRLRFLNSTNRVIINPLKCLYIPGAQLKLFQSLFLLGLVLNLDKPEVFLAFWGLNEAFVSRASQQGRAEPSQVTLKGYSSVNIILLSQLFSFLLAGVYYSSWIEVIQPLVCLQQSPFQCFFYFPAWAAASGAVQRVVWSGLMFVCFLFQNNFTDTKILLNSTPKSWEILPMLWGRHRIFIVLVKGGIIVKLPPVGQL